MRRRPLLAGAGVVLLVVFALGMVAGSLVPRTVVVGAGLAGVVLTVAGLIGSRDARAEPWPADAPGERRFSKKLILLGYAVFVAAVLISVTGSLEYLFLAVPSAIFGGLVLLAWRRGRWAAVPVLVAAILLLVFDLANDFAFRLSSIDAYSEFLLPIVGGVGALLMAAGAIAGLAGSTRVHAPAGVRIALWGVGIGLAAVTVVSVVLTFVSETGLERAGAQPFLMENTKFRPTHLGLAHGGELKLVLRNDDSSTHSFTIDELNVDEIVRRHHDRVVTIRATASGVYTYYCRVSGHQSQKGTLTVS